MSNVFLPDELLKDDEESQMEQYSRQAAQSRDSQLAEIDATAAPPLVQSTTVTPQGSSLSLAAQPVVPPAPSLASTPSAMPAAAPMTAPSSQEGPTSRTLPRDLVPDQMNGGLTYNDAIAACGPAAAIAFARAYGRNPTLGEAVQLARGVGWSASQGMAGPQSELALLHRMADQYGLPELKNARLENGVNWAQIQRDVSSGKPVIIDTPGHYFVVTDYDPASGRYYFGNSGTVYRRGAAWMTPGQMESVGAGAGRAALYLNNAPPNGIVVGGRDTSPAGATSSAMDFTRPSLPGVEGASNVLGALGRTVGQALSGPVAAAGDSAGSVMKSVLDRSAQLQASFEQLKREHPEILGTSEDGGIGAAARFLGDRSHDVAEGAALPANLTATVADERNRRLQLPWQQLQETIRKYGPSSTEAQSAEGVFNHAVNEVDKAIGADRKGFAQSSDAYEPVVGGAGLALGAATAGVGLESTGAAKAAALLADPLGSTLNLGAQAALRGAGKAAEKAGPALRDLLASKQVGGVGDMSEQAADRLGYPPRYRNQFSNVVNEDGTFGPEGKFGPNTGHFYHGTQSTFDTPDAAKFNEYSLYGPGLYASNSPHVVGEAEKGYGGARIDPAGDPYKVKAISAANTDLRQLEAEIAYDHKMIEEAYSPESKQFYESQLEQHTKYAEKVQADLAGYEKQYYSGGNVRPLKMPDDMQLFDIDQPVRPNELQSIKDTLRKMDQESGITADGVGWHFEQEVDSLPQYNAKGQLEVKGEDVYHAMQRAFSEKYGYTYDDAKEPVNEVLSRVGYDGIQHTGGLIQPTRTPDGSPVQHDTIITFGDKLHRITNALTGQQGGAAMPQFAGDLAGAVGGAAAAQVPGTDENTPVAERVARGVGGAALGLGAARLAPVAAEGLLGKDFRDAAVTIPPQLMRSDPWVAEIEKTLGSQRADQAVQEYLKLQAANVGPAQEEQFWRRAAKPPSSWHNADDWFRALGYNSMLSGIPSITMQTLSNLFELPWATGRDLAGAALRGQLMPTAKAEAYGAAAGLHAGLARAGDVLKYGLSDATAKEYSHGRVSDFPGVAGKVGKLLEAPGRSFGVVDEFFTALRQNMVTGQLAARDATRRGLSGPAWEQHVMQTIQNPPPDMLRSSYEAGQRFALKGDMGNLGRVIQKVQDVPVLGSWLAPFVKTVYNIGARGIDRSPLGFAGTAVDVARGKYAAGTKLDSHLVPLKERLGDNVLGTLVTGWFMNEALNGNISGNGPRDADERASLERQGWQANSIKLPDGTWSQYSNFGTVAVPLAMAGNLADALKYREAADDSSTTVTDMITRTARSLEQQSFLRSTLDLANSLTAFTSEDPTRAASKVAASTIASRIPLGALGRNVGMAQDPVKRDPSSVPERVIASVSPAMKGPLGREQVPPQIDPYGRDVPATATGAEALTSFRVSPKTNQATNLLDRELLRLRIPLRDPPKEVLGNKLTKTQYEDYRRRLGAAMEAALHDEISDPGWRSLEDDEQIKYIRKAEEAARKDIQYDMFESVNQEDRAAQRKRRPRERQQLDEYGVPRAR